MGRRCGQSRDLRCIFCSDCKSFAVTAKVCAVCISFFITAHLKISIVFSIFYRIIKVEDFAEKKMDVRTYLRECWRQEQNRLVEQLWMDHCSQLGKVAADKNFQFIQEGKRFCIKNNLPWDNADQFSDFEDCPYIIVLPRLYRLKRYFKPFSFKNPQNGIWGVVAVHFLRPENHMAYFIYPAIKEYFLIYCPGWFLSGCFIDLPQEEDARDKVKELVCTRLQF